MMWGWGGGWTGPAVRGVTGLLDERFARGEIDADEDAARRRVLENR